MDTRIATPLFELMLPGAWTRATPEPGLTVFRSPAGPEQLSISSLATREPLTGVDRHAKLLEFVRVRRDAELRVAPETTVSEATYLVVPERATFTAEDAARHRRSATVILVRDTGFVVLYLESVRRRAGGVRRSRGTAVRRLRGVARPRCHEGGGRGCGRTGVNLRPFRNESASRGSAA